MLQINLDTNMPQGCDYCNLMDEEFHYCHGRFCYMTWECDDYREERPQWCPLKEVQNDT